MNIIASIDKIDQTPEDIELLRNYAMQPFGFLLLAGANGTGKSYAAEAIYYCNTHFILPARDDDLAIFKTQADLNAEWLESQGVEMRWMMEKYKETKLLIIDDLGTRTPTEAFLDFLYAVIDYRWRLRDKAGTIITTNKTGAEIRQIFGSAILSRISSGVVKRWDGADRRMVAF
jgi:DNA replication protein DnaC